MPEALKLPDAGISKFRTRSATRLVMTIFPGLQAGEENSCSLSVPAPL
jgi:hypothetical protein